MITALICIAFAITYILLCLFEGYYNEYGIPIILALFLRYGLALFFIKWAVAAGFILANAGFGLILLGEAGGMSITFARRQGDR